MFSHWSRPQLGLAPQAVQEVVHRKQNLATRGCEIASDCVDNSGCPYKVSLNSGWARTEAESEWTVSTATTRTKMDLGILKTNEPVQYYSGLTLTLKQYNISFTET